jgi:hypothetical protein
MTVVLAVGDRYLSGRRGLWKAASPWAGRFLPGLVTAIRVPPQLEADAGIRIGTDIRAARR